MTDDTRVNGASPNAPPPASSDPPSPGSTRKESPVLGQGANGKGITSESWGGRRPGAGAPSGNLNALKHGRRSQQLRQLFLRAARNNNVRALLGTLAAAALLHKAGLVRRRRVRRAPRTRSGHQQGGIT